MDNQTKEQIKTVFDDTLKKLEERVKIIIENAKRTGNSLDAALAADNMLKSNPVWMLIAKNIVADDTSLKGGFNTDSIVRDLTDIARIINDSVTIYQDVSRMLVQEGGGRDLNKEEMKRQSSAVAALAGNLQTLPDAISNFASRLIQEERIKDGSERTAFSKERIIEAQGIFGGIKDFLQGKEMSQETYTQIKTKIAMTSENVANRLTQLLFVNDTLQRSGLPQPYIQSFQSILGSLGQTETLISDVYISFGMQNPPSIQARKQIHDNAKKAQEGGAQAVDPKTGKSVRPNTPGAVSPQQAMGQAQQGFAGGQAGSSSTGTVTIEQAVNMVKQLATSLKDTKRQQVLGLCDQISQILAASDQPASPVAPAPEATVPTTASNKKNWIKV